MKHNRLVFLRLREYLLKAHQFPNGMMFSILGRTDIKLHDLRTGECVGVFTVKETVLSDTVSTE